MMDSDRYGHRMFRLLQTITIPTRDGLQDSLDLFLGNYVVEPKAKNKGAPVALPYRRNRGKDGIMSVVEYIITGSLVFLCTILFVSGALVPRSMRPTTASLVTIGALLGPVLSLMMIKRGGRRFVEKPKFLLLDTNVEKFPGETSSTKKGN